MYLNIRQQTQIVISLCIFKILILFLILCLFVTPSPSPTEYAKYNAGFALSVPKHFYSPFCRQNNGIKKLTKPPAGAKRLKYSLLA